MTDEATVTTARLPWLAQIDLRVDPPAAGDGPYRLPPEPNTAWEEGDRSALWQGPDEWLLLGPAGAGPRIVEEVEAWLGDAHRSVVDVSANRAILELSGSGVRELLSKGCSIDLHPRVWTAGSCAQTMLAKAPVILHERVGATRVLVRTSFLDHLTEWLETSRP